MTYGKYIKWDDDLKGFCTWFKDKYKTEDFHLGELVKGEHFIASPVLGAINKNKTWGIPFILPLKWYLTKIKNETTIPGNTKEHRERESNPSLFSKG